MYLHRGFDLHSGRQQKEDRLKTDLWLLLGLVWELGTILGFLLLGESWSWILISHHCESTKNFVFQLFLLDFLAPCLLRRKYFNRKTDVECQAHFSAFFSSLESGPLKTWLLWHPQTSIFVSLALWDFYIALLAFQTPPKSWQMPQGEKLHAKTWASSMQFPSLWHLLSQVLASLRAL